MVRMWYFHQKVKRLQEIKPLDAESTVLDIGGNDGTLLKAYDIAGLHRVCIDPTAKKWAQYYEGTDIEVRPGFFGYLNGGGYLYEKMDIITSIACFYDLEEPNYFVQEIARVLKPQGIWHFEQSYIMSMLKTGSYDTICHEHLEYYSLGVVKRLLEANGLKIIDVELNDINGGSFAVTAAHKDSKFTPNLLNIMRVEMLEPTDTDGWMDLFHAFVQKMEAHRESLQVLIKFLNDQGYTVAGIGGSTKFNVILQYCGFTSKDIKFISDVNPEKHGKTTPGSLIQIISEEESNELMPDYCVVGPWHFRDGIIQREQNFLNKGGSLIFPLPDLEIIKK